MYYVNISAARHTWPALQASGYRRYADGQVFFAPLASRIGAGARVVEFVEDSLEAAALPPGERRLLADHARLGCVALIGLRDGAAAPFVLLPRTIWRGVVPGVHVIYCRGFDDLVVFAGALGRRFARHGRFLFVVDAVGPLAGLGGKFFGDREPRHFKGASAPSPFDLAYTELVVFGR